MWFRTTCRLCSNQRVIHGVRLDGQPTVRPCPVCSPVGCEGCQGSRVQRKYIRAALTTIACERCGGTGQQPHISYAPFRLEIPTAIANPKISAGEPVPSWMTPAPQGKRRL
jgi:hypothetical protein